MFPKRSITISVRGASEREHSETDYLLKTADNRRHIEASLIQLDGGYEVVKYTPEDLVRLA